jgi:hypothetical protein
MTETAELERRYRRLLAFYPKRFRREHQDEILSVLMAGAVAGQTRPRLVETFDLISNALVWRLRHTVLPGPWEYRHRRVMLPVRVLIGLWLVVLTVVMYGYGRGGWWGALLVPSACLHFYFAYRLRRPSAAS